MNSCSLTGTEDNSENPENLEEEAPVISIVSPNEGLVFYTEGGADTPDRVVCNASVSDASTVKKGSITIYNTGKEVVYYYEELASLLTSKNVDGAYSTFKTLQDGTYEIEFRFEDVHGNVAIEKRNVTCVYSKLEGETDN
ncbi:hypothetical protein [Hyunsoonleella rubra]|uniref:Uncharacterized protein n=1 Tax=Hyunsoonleella rubra TaxID=1737062 RepID=A0ABW5TCU9_9FLAO